MAYGALRIQTYAMRRSAPIPDVNITVLSREKTWRFTTGSEGTADTIRLKTPNKCYSLDPNNTTVQPYTVATIIAEKPGYRTVTIEGAQIFPGEITVAPIEMVTSGGEAFRIADEPIIIPPHGLFTQNGGSGPAPITDCVAPFVLDEVVVPNKITVHLGKPAVSAKNVTVNFQDYIANVASSEVYPTWPEQALRANIHAQISLALNRIYTEWYPSKGYTFNITNSTSYDQYYVHGRTVFDVMVRLTAEIFNTYVRRIGTLNPYYTEYCDGKSVTCPGMKQWGTVTLANQGKNALQILRHYYGNDIEIVRTNNIRSIPQSYPGSPVRQGDRGTSVYTLQRQLNRITKDYPFFGKLNVDGIFGSSMTQTVKTFQKQFGLVADGVVGRSTWYKISYIYVSVKDLAELTSEGETENGTLSGGSWQGEILRVGSRGKTVEQAQFWLDTLSDYTRELPALTVDGIYGSDTERAVRAFQRLASLPVDGIIGPTTWAVLYQGYESVQSDIGTPNQYPGTPIRRGDRGSNVQLIQFWLKIARTTYPELENLSVDGIYGRGTESAVTTFQRYFRLTADGIVGRATWNKLQEVYNGVANNLLSPSLRPGEYPGVLRRGSTGTPVKELQYYLFVMAAYDPDIPTVSIDGVFGADTERSVKAFQRRNSLTIDGIVGRTTWESLYQQAGTLRLSGAVVTITRIDYPGTPLKLGDHGPDVLYFSSLITRIAYYFDTIANVGLTDTYTPLLEEAVKDFQELEGIPVTGIADEVTWITAEALSLTLLSSAGPNPMNFPEYQASGVGSAGARVQQIQRWLDQLGNQMCGYPHTDVTGSFVDKQTVLIQQLQIENGLNPTGVVDNQTWRILRTKAERSN